MEQGGGDRANPSGEDHLSALPDDPLLHILLHLDTAAAVRTSVLSRRWWRAWTLLSELRFDFSREPHPVASALAAHEAALDLLHVGVLEAAPDSLAAWLPVAASRLSGCLIFENRAPWRSENDDDDERGAIELPCFEHATAVSLDLGFLRLAVPAAGIFARLTELRLFRVRICGPCKLGDAVSSSRCPCLQKLIVQCAQGLDDIIIQSESLLQMKLMKVRGLKQLKVVAPTLKDLGVTCCFLDGQNQPVADISAPKLKSITWQDAYDPSSVHICKMEHLESLSTYIHPFGQDDFTHNGAFSKLLLHFEVIGCLFLLIVYPQDLSGFQYLMEGITMVPQVTVLALTVVNNGHAFGGSLFHLLKMCNGLRILCLELYTPDDFEAQDMCPSGCTFDQPANWKTEELTLNCLQEIGIVDVKGTDHEVEFVKRLFSWAMVPTQIQIIFNYLISERKARELRQTLSTFCKPETILKCYKFCNAGDRTRYLLAP